MSPTQAYFDHDDEDLDGQENRKRSSRACDQCRKTKSKCERTHPDDDNVPCKTCMLNNTVCTFAGPSYKRGPPKGYIHAIEQRWHHVEAVLGSILSSHDPRAQSLINDLRKDDLAREILNRVDVGPFGPAGRIRSSGRVDSLSSLLLGGRADGHSSHASKEGRSRRQSRVSREIVSSSQDLDPLPEATLEWQDRLTSRIGGTGYASASTNGYPSSQRRRLDAPEFDKMYTFESTDTSTTSDSQEEGEDHIDAMGHLSLDENREVRFHGKASGLHLISNRTDDRKDGGLWKLPMPGVWPPSTIRPVRLEQEEDIEIHLPAIGDQDHLLELYFTYVHPGFPVIHKGRFLEEWQSQRRGSPIIDSHPRNRSGSPYSSQVSKALLLAMFALAARYLEQPPEGTHTGAMWEIGCNYALDCREVLNKIYHHSRLSTCQALLLLSLHEFGIGMTEHAWMFIGMAIRMAEDLGLNRVADHWKYKGNDLFTPDEKQMRKVVWFGCYIVDVFISVYLGRPSAISDCDYDTPLPDIPDDDAEPWRPYVHDPGFHPKYNPGPGHVISCFRQTMGVIRIQSDIIKQIYPVVYVSRTPKRVRLAELEKRLDQWYIDLPEELRYESVGKRAVPPPHIMVLHVRYWSAVLLLHRAFIPRMNDAMAPRGSTDHDTVVLKSFDLCQSAASHISTIVAQYDEHFGMKRSPLFLACYILSAGIMHVVTLNLRENNIQASIGLRQCLAALEKMETIWPSASRHKDLLTGADVQFQGILTPLANAPERYKRPADDLHNSPDKASHILQRQVFNNYDPESSMGAPAPSDDTRVMARMLGLEVGPGIQPSTSYFPGYEWWPSIPISAPHHHQQHPQQGQPGQMRGHPDALPPMHIPQPGSHPSSQQTSPTTASSNHEWTSPSAYPGYGYGPPANGYGYAR